MKVTQYQILNHSQRSTTNKNQLVNLKAKYTEWKQDDKRGYPTYSVDVRKT